MSSKAGLGCYHGRNGIEDVINSDAHACVLFDDARGSAARIKATCPQMQIIARKFNTDERALILTGEAGGRAYARQVHAECPQADAYLPINEAIPGIDRSNPDISGQLAAQLYWVERQAVFEYGFTDELHKLCKRSVIINAGPGIIPAGDVPGQFVGWARAYDRVIGHPGCLWIGVHLYGSGDDPTGKGRLAAGDPTWFFRRYERFFNGMQARVTTMKPLAATEWGQTRGWRGYLNEEETTADLVWSLTCVKDDGRIACLIYYLDGTVDPAKWGPFDIHGTSIPGRLAAWNRANPTTITIPTGGITMKYSERFPADYQAWLAAGGAESNFTTHCLAIHPEIKPSAEDVKTAIGNAAAAAKQAEAIAGRFPFA